MLEFIVRFRTIWILYIKYLTISYILVNQIAENEDLAKSIRNARIVQVLFKQNKSYCNCRIKACFHTGQLDLALKILRLSGFGMEKIRVMMMN